MDGRTALLLGRLLAILSATEGELALTFDRGQVVASVVVGGRDVPLEARGTAVGRGSLFAALANLDRALAGTPLTTAEALRPGIPSPFAQESS